MPRGPQGKLLPVYLEPDVYRQLDQRAQAEEREVTQQARLYIKRALGEPTDSPDGPRAA
jgi:hypothetical protein